MALKVIGAGGPRTGTSSLKTALETIGFGKSYHMEWVFSHPDDAAVWTELCETGNIDFDSLFDGFQSTVDFPGFMHYKVFMEKYPEAKVVLTDRDPEEWYQSALNTVYSASPTTIGKKLQLIMKMMTSARFRKLAKAFKLLKNHLWAGHFEGRFHDKEFAIAKYNSFNEEVKASVPADKLLVYKVTDGWEPLCTFLNVPVPEEEFPHRNKRESFKLQVAHMMKTGRGIEVK